MTYVTRRWAVLLLSAVAGLAQADTSASLSLQYGVTITGWHPADDGSEYPASVVDGFGGYAVNLEWPGHTVSVSEQRQYGLPLYEPGYGFVASAAFIGGYSASSISFPGTASGSAQTFGTAVSTWTVLPGVTLTIDGNVAGSALIEDEHTSGDYSIRLSTWGSDDVETLYALEGTWDLVGYGEFGDSLAYSFTNTSDVPVSRSFGIESFLSLDAAPVPPVVTPVPEPATYALLLAGLSTLAALGRRGRRAHQRADR